MEPFACTDIAGRGRFALACSMQCSALDGQDFAEGARRQSTPPRRRYRSSDPLAATLHGDAPTLPRGITDAGRKNVEDSQLALAFRLDFRSNIASCLSLKAWRSHLTAKQRRALSGECPPPRQQPLCGRTYPSPPATFLWIPSPACERLDGRGPWTGYKTPEHSAEADAWRVDLCPNRASRRATAAGLEVDWRCQQCVTSRP